MDPLSQNTSPVSNPPVIPLPDSIPTPSNTYQPTTATTLVAPSPTVLPISSIQPPIAPQPLSMSPDATNDVYAAICSRIVKEQSQIIGLLALEQANQVPGLLIDEITFHCNITGDGSKIVESLVDQYRDFFGNAAVEVCREAASHFMNRLPEGAMPSLLR